MSIISFWRYEIILTNMLLMFLLTNNIYAGNVVIKNPENNKGERFVVDELKEGSKFYHDRDYTLTGVPKEFLGLTCIMTSVDSLGGLDYRWTFEIDRSAFVYIAFDSRFKMPSERKQDPPDWFNKSFSETKKSFFLDAPHPKTEYFIYKSNEPLSKRQSDPVWNGGYQRS